MSSSTVQLLELCSTVRPVFQAVLARICVVASNAESTNRADFKEVSAMTFGSRAAQEELGQDRERSASMGSGCSCCSG